MIVHDNSHTDIRYQMTFQHSGMLLDVVTLLHCSVMCCLFFLQKLRSCWIFLTAVVTLSCVASVCFTYFVKWASDTATNFLVALIYILTNAFCLWYLALSKNETPIPPLQTAWPCCSALPIAMCFPVFGARELQGSGKKVQTNPIVWDSGGGRILVSNFAWKFGGS